MLNIKILQLLQFWASFVGIVATPIDQCIYGFFGFALGCTQAVLQFMMPVNVYDLQETPFTRKQEILLFIIEAVHDYVPIGLLNMELHELSSQYSLLNYVFCLPLALDLLTHLFSDANFCIVDEKILRYLKASNAFMHCLSLGALAMSESNIWLMCTCLATVVIGIGVFNEGSNLYDRKCVKLFGYILLYIFASMGIYDLKSSNPPPGVSKFY